MGGFPGAQVTKTRPAVVLATEEYHRHRPDVVVGLITAQTPSPLAPTDCALRDWKQAVAPYFESRMKVGTMPAAEEKPVFPMESQLEQPCTLPR